MDEKQLQILWDSFAKDGGFKDYNEYKELMSDEKSRKVFFDSYKSDLGFNDYEEFNSLLSPPKSSEGSSRESQNTSQTSSELSKPSQSTNYGGLGAQPLGETRFDLGVNDINFEVAPQLPNQVIGENGEILNVEIGQAELIPTDKKTYLQSLENSLNNNL